MVRHPWDREHVYAAFGLSWPAVGDYTHLQAGRVPADMKSEIMYLSCKVEMLSTAEKGGGLYRCFATCRCGKRLSIAKMGQHLSYKKCFEEVANG